MIRVNISHLPLHFLGLITLQSLYTFNLMIYFFFWNLVYPRPFDDKVWYTCPTLLATSAICTAANVSTEYSSSTKIIHLSDQKLELWGLLADDVNGVGDENSQHLGISTPCQQTSSKTRKSCSRHINFIVVVRTWCGSNRHFLCLSSYQDAHPNGW